MPSEYEKGPEGIMRLVLVIIAMLVGASTQTLAQDTETMLLEAQRAKTQYWDCLSNETKRVAPRKMSAQEFVSFMRSVCLNDQSLFRNALIKLFARNRNTDQQTVNAKIEGVIADSIDHFTGIYADLKSDRKQP
jgi:hypothetical protein